jgi:hypothetical protein
MATLKLMGKTGYNLETVDVAPNPSPCAGIMPAGLPLQMIYIVEKGRTTKIFQPEMSQGMFRALSLLIQIKYN